MKKQLFFLILWAFLSPAFTQAKDVGFSTSGKTSDNIMGSVSSASKSDTLAIPWREDFEFIATPNTLPYGMSCTYNRSALPKGVRTFTEPTVSPNKERVKARSGDNYIVFSSKCDDWVFTPGLFLRAGTEYTFSFWCDTMSGYWQCLEAKVGMLPTPEAMKIRILDTIKGPARAGYKKYEGSFIASKDAVYYFGIHAANSSENYFMAIDDLEVNTTPPACKAISLYLRNVTTSSIEFYRTYTPVANYKMILNYRKKAITEWDFMDVTNQESVRLSNLAELTDYEARLGVVCSTADTLWSSVITAKTLANPVDPGGVFPINLNFDGTDVAWYVMNDSVSITKRNYNKWYIDSVGGNIIPGRTVAYISNDGGVSNTYKNTYSNETSVSTRYFLFPEAEEFFFSFSYRAFTNTINDYLRVELKDPPVNIFGSGMKLRVDSNMTTKTVVLPGTYSNTVQRLVITWVNSMSGTGGTYPAVIDSVILRSITCGTPKELSMRKVFYNSILLRCTAILGNNTSFEIAYKEKGTPESNWRIKSGLLKMDSLLLEGLNSNTDYDIKIRKRYSIDSSFWTPAIQVKTTVPPTQPGLNEDFENFNAQRCVVKNEGQTNKWIVGSHAEGASGKTIYISDDGVNNHYSDTNTSIVHFYYDLDLAQAETFRLSFDWKGVGKAIDCLRVSLVDVEVNPESGKILPLENRIFEKDFYNRRTWTTEAITFNKTYTGTPKRLVFTWVNLPSTGGMQPAIAIDNIRFDAINCTTPENLMLIGSDTSNIALMSKKIEPGNSFVVSYKKAEPFEEWNTQTIPTTAFISQDKFKLAQLEPGTNYEVKVRKQCGADTSLYTSAITARTIQLPSGLPLSENFENETTYSKWQMLNERQTNQWMVGNAIANGGSKSLYITDQHNTGNTYDPTKRSVVHFYRDIKFGEATEYELSFNWKGGNANSFMSVYVADINQPIQSGVFDSRGSFGDGIRYSGSSEWKRGNMVITRPDQFVNSTRSLVFTWVCDGIGGNEAPFAIDNIELKAIKCSHPTDLTIIDFPTSSTSDKVEIEFLDVNNINNYVISCTNLENNATFFAHANTTQPIVAGFQHTDYEIKVRTICPQGADSSLWSKGITVKMPQKYDTLPFVENFENPNNVKLWTCINGANMNNWFFGSATFAPEGGNQAAYIDSLEGSNNGCKPVRSVVHLYRDIDFPLSAGDFFLNFQWKEMSSLIDTANSSYLKVNIIDLDVLPVAGEEISKTLYSTPKIFSNDKNVIWNKEMFMIPKNLLLGKKKRLVFSWRNEAAYIGMPPVAIDNINLIAPKCNLPENIRYTMLSPTSVQLNWTCKYDAKNNFYFDLENNPHLNKYVGADTSAVLDLMKSNTPYNISLTNKCNAESNIPVEIAFRTNQQVPVLPFVDKFNDENQIKEWTFVNGNNPNRWIAGNIKSTGESTDIKTAAFVSTDGVNNFYYGIDSSKNALSVIHLYRDVFFDNTDKLALSFDWRTLGNIANDYMKVYLVDSNFVPVPNTMVDKKYEIVAPDTMNFALQRVWKTEYFTIKGVKNTKKRLIFSWRNKQLTQDVLQPPAAISNVEIQAIDCNTPTSLSLKSYYGENAVVLTWENLNTDYKLQYRQTGGGFGWDTVSVTGRNFDTLKFDPSSKNITYEVQVKNNCGGQAIWSPIFYFNTLQEVGIVPFFEDFAEPENREQWNIVNGTELNSWFIDTAVYAEGKGNFAAYISDNGGRTNTYIMANPESSVVHLYRDIDILPNQKELQLLIDWKGYGEPVRDYMRIYLLHKDSIPKAEVIPPTASLLTTKYFGHYKHNWKRENIVVPANTLNPGRNRLVFTWVNNNMDGEQSPMAIDNIAINMSSCLSPTNITSTAIGRDSVALKWNTQKETSQYFNLRYRKIEKGNNNELWQDSITVDSNCVLRGLTANRLYEIQVQTQCSSDTSVWKSYLVQTQQIPSNLPVNENFESDTAYNAWTFANGEVPNAWFINSMAYISDEGGRTFHYPGILPTESISHFYKDITFPPAVEYLLSYHWTAMGESKDYLQVYLTDVDKPVTAGISIPSVDKQSEPLYDNRGWSVGGVLLPPDKFLGKTKRLVFSWKTDAVKAVQHPAAVDNIIFRALDCITPTNLKVVDYPDLHSATIEWTSTGDTFTVAYGKATDPQPWPELGVRGEKKVTLSGLDSNTLYYAKVKNSCAENTIFTNTVEIRTLNTPIMKFPFVETFENDSPTKDKWLIVNGTHLNAWYIGKNTAAKGGEKSMYISADGGDSNIAVRGKGITHFYRDIIFPESGTVEMSFDWKLRGLENIYYLQVALTDVIEDPKQGESPRGSILGKYFSTPPIDWKTSSILFQDSTLKGKRKRIVFSWVCAQNTDPLSPPAAVDNIAFTWFNCSSVQNLQAKATSNKQVALSWTGASEATSYTIAYKPLESETWIDKEVTESKDTIEGLQSNTYYTFRVALNCDAGFGKPIYDTVLLGASIPFIEDFDTVPTGNWIRCSTSAKLTDNSLTLSSNKGNWSSGFFANAAYASKAAKITTDTSRREWLMSPPVYLTPGTKTQLEFNLGLTWYGKPEAAPDKTGGSDKFIVLVSENDNKWSAKDAILTWDNKGYNQVYNKINYTREGDKIKVSLENYSGLVRIAFYVETTTPYSFNDLFLDSVIVRAATCQKVQEVQVSKIGLDSATVAWLAPQEQYKWQVQCTKSDGTLVVTEELIELNKLRINTLEKNTEYNVSVRSICNEADTSAWLVKKFTTKSTCVGVPGRISVAQTNNSAVITWETQPTHKKWRLHYGLATQDRDQMPFVIVDTSLYAMSNLEQLTDYAFYIQAICIAGDTGNWAEKQTYKTLRTPCLSVSNLTAKDVKVSAATITWEANASQTQWEIRYGLPGTSLNAMSSVFATDKTKILTKLLKNTTYNCYVRGICGVGDTSVWSAKATYTTLECTTVENLRFTKNNEGKNVLNWTAGTGHTSWVINIADKATGTTVGTQTVNDTTFTVDYTVLGIDTKRDYILTVKTNCDNNTSQYWSNPITLSSVGILTTDANQNIRINLTPNPTNDIAKLSIEGAKGLVTVQIFSVKGELINTENLYCEEGKVKEMKITGLPSGPYIIRLLNEKWVTTEKLIVN